MFKERFEPLQVEIRDNMDGNISIFITQPAMCDDDSVIMISPEQVDILISSLKRAKESLDQDSIK